MAARRTRYQMTHRPTRTVEVLCTSRKPLDSHGFCPDCLRYLARGGRDHHPNAGGLFGYVEYYADGTTRTLPPDPDALRWYAIAKDRGSAATERTSQ